MAEITALRVQKRDANRVNVYLDGAFAFGLDALAAARLRKGQVLTDAEVVALQHGDAITRAVDHGARLLTSRPRSRAELRTAWARKEVPPAVQDAAEERLRALGVLDDRAFAQYWVAARSGGSRPRGDRALRAELRQKGVPDAIIREVLAAHAPTEDDGALRAARARLPRLRGHAPRDVRHKLSSYLLRRGFGYDAVQSALAQLLDEQQATDPAFFGTADDDPFDDDLTA